MNRLLTSKSIFPKFCKLPYRFLNLQEYQSKCLMKEFEINVQPFFIVQNINQDLSSSNFNRLNASEYVVKAQVLAGGRKKGTFKSGFEGGVHLTKSENQVADITGKMIGEKLVTNQTGKEGLLVDKVLVSKALDLEKEAYLAILLDRERSCPVIIASKFGGINIENVPHDDIHKFYIDNVTETSKGSISYQLAYEIAEKFDFSEKWGSGVVEKTAVQIQNLYKMFLNVDATLLEVNPFGLTTDGQVVSFDAKINFDDNAQFRQNKVFSMEDTKQDPNVDPFEQAANEIGLNYISMDGNIGCVVNGAGLAMATMDEIELAGGKPANFLDVGGSVTEDQVLSAFQLLSKHEKMKCLFINVFGGIVDCAIIARGVIKAVESYNMTIPIIVRLVGNNSKEANLILANYGKQISTCSNFTKAAEMSVEMTHL